MHRFRLISATLFVVVAYFATARLGLSLLFSHPELTTIWAPSGIALAAVVLGGYRMLPAVAFGALLSSLPDSLPFLAVIGITIASTAEAALAVALLRRARFDPRLSRLRDVIALAALAGVVSTSLGATVGIATLRLTGVLGSEHLFDAWRTWWLGDHGGVVLIGTAILVAAEAFRQRLDRRQLGECLACIVALGVAAALLFTRNGPVAYLPFPALVLVALRYGQLGVALGGVVVAALDMWFTSHGYGPFVGGSRLSGLLRAQAFADVVTITALMVAATRSERSVAERALERLEASDRALEEAQRLTNIGRYEWDVVADVTTWSDQLYSIVGRDPATCPATYKSWLECVHEDDRDRVHGVVREAFDERTSYSFQNRLVRGDGMVRTVECHGRVIEDADGRVVQVVGTCQDVTAFQLAENRFRALLESAPDAIVISDEDGQVVLVNSQTERMFGYSRSELIGAPVEWLVPAWFAARPNGDGDPLADPPRPAMRSGIDLFARRKDGSEFPVEISLGLLETEQGRLISASVRDVTERRLAADALAHQATHDPLTGLPNRTLFLDRLDHALARARRSRGKLGVLFLDMDDFKLVNDTQGHEAGDLLLVALTPRLSAALRPGDTVARFGGDEFVVLCEDLVVDAAALSIAQRIGDACSRPIKIGDHEHTVTVSTGVVIVDGGASTPSNVLRDADAAMYRAKAQGKGRIELFDEGMRAQLIERMAIESSLRRALENGELRLFYQPVYSLERNQIVGVEALLRWQHPMRGLLEPADFISIAEDSGLIVPIGEWVLEQACRQAASWRDRANGAEPLHVSVNLSPRQVTRSNVVAAVQRVLRNTGLEPELLDLEITEHTLIEEGEASALALRELKDVGVRLVLDDFGTGYSSLSYLKRYTIDALKIDRSFVDGLGSADSGDGAIVNAVVSMARELDVGVTAEGVETAAQLAQLRENGCPFAQGYLFSRPAPPEELDAMLGYGEPVPA
jgi:diguanylate cyclase (GGDEF)-like protein/PAS domain S-box-containing protein